MNNDKYPRTYHLPYSPGATKDDKKLQAGWFDNFAGQEIVITSKLDGENTHFLHRMCTLVHPVLRPVLPGHGICGMLLMVYTGESSR